MEWKTTTLNLLYKLLTSPLGNVINKPLDMEWFVKQHVVLELNNVGNSKDKSFLIRTLLLRLYYHFLQHGSSHSLKLLLVIEEAHNILLKKDGTESIIELLLRQIREFSVGMCIVDQHPSLISLPALGTYCTIAFNLKLQQDRNAMASALNLEQPEYLGKLPPQFAIVKIQDRFLTPFLIKTFQIGKGKDAGSEIQRPPIHPYLLTPTTTESEIEDIQEVLSENSTAHRNPVKKVRAKRPVPQHLKSQREIGEQILRRLKAAGHIPPLSPEEIQIGTYDEKLIKERMAKVISSLQSQPSEDSLQSSGENVKTDSEDSDKVIRNQDGMPKNIIHPLDDKQVIRGIKEDSEVIRQTGEVVRAGKPVIRHEVDVIRGIPQTSRSAEHPLITWEDKMMNHISQYPLLSTVERYHHLGINEYQGNKHKIALLKKGYITIESISTSSGRVKLMVLTAKGVQWLNERGFSSQQSDKEGGIQHQYWKKRLHDVFSKHGYAVKLEVPLRNNQAIDIVVSHNKRRVAVEIETGTNTYEHILGNIQKCLGHSNGVVSFILDAEKAKKVKARLTEQKHIVIVSDETRCVDAVLKFLQGGDEQ
jgi:hypothetical protein